MRFWIVLTSLVIIGCGSRVPVPAPKGALTDPEQVIAHLHAQLDQWKGTPYREGGADRYGVDCSGFVWLTFRERFTISLPRTTKALSVLGNAVPRQHLRPGDLLFFKTGQGNKGLHVGIYQTQNRFIHASTSRGVMLSSLQNRYWRKVYWLARRL